MAHKKKLFSVNELRELIECCGAHGVKRFSMGDVVVVFKESSPAEAPASNTENLSADQVALSVQELRHELEKQEIQTKEEQLQEMILRDPLQFEELLAMGELTEDGERTHSGAVEEIL